MKLFIMMILYATTLFSTTLHYEHNLSKALQKASGQNKEVMMMYSATWCPECAYMKDVVFKDKKMLKYMDEHFIVLTLDIDHDVLPKGFDFVGIPTFFIVDKNLKKQGRILGGSKANIFLQKLKAVK